MLLRERLRLETRAQHQQLEDQLDLLRPGLAPPQLITLLERFYGYYCECETQLKCLPVAQQDWFAARAKTSLLAGDLHHFGHSPADIESLPRPALAVADTRAKALGRWYVLEGSTLGGQMLARHFRATLPLTDGAGCSFFESYGSRVGQMWREYCATLDELTDPADQAEAVRFANQTFESLAEWLKPACSHIATGSSDRSQLR